MKQFWLVPIAACMVNLWSPELARGQADNVFLEKLPSNGRVVVLGNSITYAGHYIHQFVTAGLLNGTYQNLEFINLGLPSETVSGLSEDGHAGGEFPRPNLHDRLGRIMDTLSPDLVIACYGINDGIYLPFDPYRFEQYVEGMERLHREVTRKGARIVLLSPPVYDPVHDESYAEVIHHYADWLIQQRDEKDWEIIDIHWPMFEFLTGKRSTDTSFYLAKDGIHPNELGHWLMAKSLLKAFNVFKEPLPNEPGTFFCHHPDGIPLLRLCSERINLSRDYWLHKIGHERPGIKPPLPEKEFQHNYNLLGKKMRDKLKQIQSNPISVKQIK